MTYGDLWRMVLLLYIFVVDVYASVGDRSLSFRKCFRGCEADCSVEDPGASEYYHISIIFCNL